MHPLLLLIFFPAFMMGQDDPVGLVDERNYYSVVYPDGRQSVLVGKFLSTDHSRNDKAEMVVTKNTCTTIENVQCQLEVGKQMRYYRYIWEVHPEAWRVGTFVRNGGKIVARSSSFVTPFHHAYWKDRGFNKTPRGSARNIFRCDRFDWFPRPDGPRAFAWTFQGESLVDQFLESQDAFQYNFLARDVRLSSVGEEYHVSEIGSTSSEFLFIRSQRIMEFLFYSQDFREHPLSRVQEDAGPLCVVEFTLVKTSGPQRSNRRVRELANKEEGYLPISVDRADRYLQHPNMFLW